MGQRPTDSLKEFHKSFSFSDISVIGGKSFMGQNKAMESNASVSQSQRSEKTSRSKSSSDRHKSSKGGHERHKSSNDKPKSASETPKSSDDKHKSSSERSKSSNDRQKSSYSERPKSSSEFRDRNKHSKHNHSDRQSSKPDKSSSTVEDLSKYWRKFPKIENRSWKPSKFGENLNNYGLRNGEIPFSFLSFNILSDKLMADHPELYRDKKRDLLDWDKRFGRLADIIKKLEPDVIAFQEVEAVEYDSNMMGRLEELGTDALNLITLERGKKISLIRLGYGGVYKKRTGEEKVDGCATFYKLEKFELDSKVEVEYKKEDAACLDRDNIGLIVKLKPKAAKGGNQRLIVANTHLLFNPRRVDVRLAQIVVLLAELHKVM